MAEEKRLPMVQISIAAIAIIIAESMTGHIRPEDSDPIELLEGMKNAPELRRLAAASMSAALRIAEYVKTQNDTVHALHKMGVI